MAKVLLLGADESVQSLYSEILSASGFDAVGETTAKDGLDRLMEEFFSGVVLFLHREEALWFLIKLRALKTVRVSATPVLAIVDETSEQFSEYYDSGATKCISKFPASGDKLTNELRNILNLPKMKL